MWAVWGVRNKLIHESISPDIAIVVSFIKNYVAEFEASQVVSYKPSLSSSSRWLAPSVVYPHSHIPNPSVAEAQACLDAISLAKDLFFRNIIIEGDSLTVINKLQSSSNDMSLIGTILSDVNSLSKFFKGVTFNFVTRACNEVAHKTTLLGRNSASFLVWVGRPSQSLKLLLKRIGDGLILLIKLCFPWPLPLLACTISFQLFLFNDAPSVHLLLLRVSYHASPFCRRVLQLDFCFQFCWSLSFLFSSFVPFAWSV
ncbi:hypothetical protein V6N12_027380 [Hibiscus sabdariffa]|uniref:RNase H type-1 domain-containing protein n=1 Tax=Hibiscus sabdariffa TaxID=183260 RepID=A0ABR2DUY7_9ROSI